MHLFSFSCRIDICLLKRLGIKKNRKLTNLLILINTTLIVVLFKQTIYFEGFYCSCYSDATLNISITPFILLLPLQPLGTVRFCVFCVFLRPFPEAFQTFYRKRNVTIQEKTTTVLHWHVLRNLYLSYEGANWKSLITPGDNDVLHNEIRRHFILGVIKTHSRMKEKTNRTWQWQVLSCIMNSLLKCINLQKMAL